MRNSQLTRRTQAAKSHIRAKSYSDFPDAHEIPRRTPEERRKYEFSQTRLAQEGKLADTWWPPMSAAILEDARRCERIRLAAESELMEDLHDWQRKARKAKRDAKPIMSRGAMLALAKRGTTK